MGATKKAVYDVEFKSLDGEPGAQPGEFKAVVSVFGNVDLQGDRVMPGAYKKSLERWTKSGDPIPVIWSHKWDEPAAHIGYVDPKNAKETPVGLEMQGRIVFDDNPYAKQVHTLLTSRRVKGWSFAYDVGNEGRGPDGANELYELDIIEVGPTLKGANPEATTLAAKSLDEALAEYKALHPESNGKAGRRLSQATMDKLRELHADIGKLHERVQALIGESEGDGGDGDGGKSFSHKGHDGLEEQVRGSWQDVTEQVQSALRSKDTANVDRDVVATFPDHVIVSVEGDPNVEYESIPYTIDADGAVSFGDATPVEIEVDVLAAAGKSDPLDVVLDEHGNVVQFKAAVAIHHTATTTGAWDGPAQVAKLASPLPVSVARQVFAWIDESKVTSG